MTFRLQTSPRLALYWSNEEDSDLRYIYSRKEGPALIAFNGAIFYYEEGLRERKDGPRSIYPEGIKLYGLDGYYLYREDPDQKYKASSSYRRWDPIKDESEWLVEFKIYKEN